MIDVTEIGGGLQVPVGQIGQARFVAVEAALDPGAAMNTGPEVPWSVPWDALASTRLPNSEYTITTTLRPRSLRRICFRKGASAESRAVSRC